MGLELSSPTTLRIRGHSAEELKRLLTYRDLSVDFELRRVKKSAWLRQKMGEEEFAAKVEELKEARVKCMLFEDDEKGIWTYSGFAGLLSSHLGEQVQRSYALPEPKVLPWAKTPDKVQRPYQVQGNGALIQGVHGAVEIGCHGRGQRVVMRDGSLKEVQNVVVGDELMGPDSYPRKVLELRSGRDALYSVTTHNGQTMLVNGHHLLVLRRTKRRNRSSSAVKANRRDFKGDNPEVIISVNDYLGESEKFKHLYKLYGCGIALPSRPIPVDPYFLGVLLGDGSILTGINVTTADSEVELECERQARAWGLSLSKRHKPDNEALGLFLVGARGVENPLFAELRDLGLAGRHSGDKFVPEVYKFNDFDTRAAVLAGLIDTDGSLTGGCFDYVSKSQRMAEDVAYLARSLGLRVSGPRSCQKKCQTGVVGEYFRLCISGNLCTVPTRIPRKQAEVRRQKKNPLTFGFAITKISDDEEYFGFVLDKDHLYLTDTFLVTHNTGLGKSFMVLNLAKYHGLQTVIMAPSLNIAEQLYEDLVTAFGRKVVGFYGDGRKEMKLITVAISASMTKVEPGTPAYSFFRGTAVFIVDESHLVAAKTLAKVCFGVMALAPYRYFFSGTQMRGDGADLLLKGITGEVRFEMSVKDGVDQKWLARPFFKMVKCRSDKRYYNEDANKMTRAHLYYNDEVNRIAADLVNKSVHHLGQQVLVLVEELEQFQRLKPLLKFPAGFAHGPIAKADLKYVPEAHWRSDVKALVQDFNARKFPILVGTSCISTGTDIQTAEHVIYLQGGKSEVGVRQAVGRGTRKIDGQNKTCFNLTDFRVECTAFDRETCVEKHAQERARIYENIYPNSLQEVSCG